MDTTGLFERYRREVYGWAYRLLGRHHDALDAAQDVFLRWIDQSRRGAPENPRGWLRQVTINRAIDVLRTRRLADRAAASMSEGHEPDLRIVGEPPAGTDALDKEQLRRDIVEALRELTDAQRSVLVAKVFDGLTFAEIAEELQVAVPTAKTHYLRAVSAVRDKLARRWGPERKKS